MRKVCIFTFSYSAVQSIYVVKKLDYRIADCDKWARKDDVLHILASVVLIRIISPWVAFKYALYVPQSALSLMPILQKEDPLRSICDELLLRQAYGMLFQ